VADTPEPAGAKGKGSGLTRKLGPLPLWAWALIGLAGGYFLYKRMAGTGGPSAVASQAAQTSAETAPSSTGLTGSAGSPSDTGQMSSDLISALGGQQATILQELEATNQDVLGLAASQISAAQANGVSPSSTTETQPVTGQQPGGSNSPTYYFLSPSLSGAPAASKPATTASVAPQPKPGVATKYFTYKRDVPLAGGQTVHFTSGRGYYAA
jgi:hypothetical protein